MIKQMKETYRYLRMRKQEFQLCMKEFRANRRTNPEAKEADFKNRMLLQVHRVEKGLGLRDCQPGHSAEVALDLVYRMKEYLIRGYDIHDYAFQETFAVFCAYLQYQEQYGAADWKPLADLQKGYQAVLEKIGETEAEAITAAFAAGAKEFTCEEIDGSGFAFDQFVGSRHSMRMYQHKNISDEELQQAVKTANQAPSACNRQAAYVYYANSMEQAARIDSLITGSHGFEGQTPNYLIVTEDRAQFKGEEQFQWYINGGIYVSFLILALHSMGIGSCVMQWKAFHHNEKKLKELAGISDREAIVAIIGCGYYDRTAKCICAQRKCVEDTLRRIGS